MWGHDVVASAIVGDVETGGYIAASIGSAEAVLREIRLSRSMQPNECRRTGPLRDLQRRKCRVALPFACWNVGYGRILAVPDPPLEVRSPVLFHRSWRLRDRRHQWRCPKMLCAISRPIPQPNPCTTDRTRPAPCSGVKTAIPPTAKPARTIILTTMLLEIEAEETDRRGRRDRAVRPRNSSAGLSRAGAVSLGALA